MKIRDIMTTQVSTASPDTTLEEIATLMKDEDVGAIPIVEDDELTGIVTDRDIVIRCIAEGRDATQTCAEDIATSDIESISPDENVHRAAEIMGRHQIRRLPVIEKGRLVGMVSLGDIAVKETNDTESAEALEDISRGVKGRGGKGQDVKGQDVKGQRGKGAVAAKPKKSASIRGPRPASAPSAKDDRVSRLSAQALRQHRDSPTKGRSSTTTRTNGRRKAS